MSRTVVEARGIEPLTTHSKENITHEQTGILPKRISST